MKNMYKRCASHYTVATASGIEHQEAHHGLMSKSAHWRTRRCTKTWSLWKYMFHHLICSSSTGPRGNRSMLGVSLSIQTCTGEARNNSIFDVFDESLPFTLVFALSWDRRNQLYTTDQCAPLALSSHALWQSYAIFTLLLFRLPVNVAEISCVQLTSTPSLASETAMLSSRAPRECECH